MPERAFELARERAEVLAIKVHLKIPNAVQQELEWPSSLGDLGEDQLAEHLAYWANLAGYAGVQAAIMRKAFSEAEADFHAAFDTRYRALSMEYAKVTDRKHHSGGSREVRIKRRKAATLQGDAGVLSSLESLAERRYQAISRELTRRRGDLGRE